MMNLQQAIDSGHPFKWENWHHWFTFCKATGTLICTEPEKAGPVTIVPVHQALASKWIVKTPEPEVIDWYKPTLLWHRRLEIYRESRNWYPSEQAMLEAYSNEYDIVEFEVQELSRKYRAV